LLCGLESGQLIVGCVAAPLSPTVQWWGWGPRDQMLVRRTERHHTQALNIFNVVVLARPDSLDAAGVARSPGCTVPRTSTVAANHLLNCAAGQCTPGDQSCESSLRLRFSPEGMSLSKVHVCIESICLAAFQLAPGSAGGMLLGRRTSECLLAEARQILQRSDTGPAPPRYKYAENART
jgi:hypothetical protein